MTSPTCELFRFVFSRLNGTNEIFLLCLVGAIFRANFLLFLVRCSFFIFLFNEYGTNPLARVCLSPGTKKPSLGNVVLEIELWPHTR